MWGSQYPTDPVGNLGSTGRYVPAGHVASSLPQEIASCINRSSVVTAEGSAWYGRPCLSSGLILQDIPGCRVSLWIDSMLGRTRGQLCRALQKTLPGITCVEEEGMIEIVLEISITVVRPCTWRAPRAAFLPPRDAAQASLPPSPSANFSSRSPEPARLFRPPPTTAHSKLSSHSRCHQQPQCPFLRSLHIVMAATRAFIINLRGVHR